MSTNGKLLTVCKVKTAWCPFVPLPRTHRLAEYSSYAYLQVFEDDFHKFSLFTYLKNLMKTWEKKLFLNLHNYFQNYHNRVSLATLLQVDAKGD